MKKTVSVLLMAMIAVLLVVAPVAADGHLVFPIGEGDQFHWENLDAFMEMDLSGQEVSVFGPWIDVDQELVESVFAYFEEATGADVVYSGSDSFEQQIIISMESGSPPDVAIFPQPGLAANAAANDQLLPLSDELQEHVLSDYAAGQSWVDLGTYTNSAGEENFYGYFYKVDLKSIVWYVPDEFEDAGYEVPESMEDLIALSEQIVEDGGTPWCIGLGSGDATGWPATDWVEDIMLRTQPPEVYDAWVTNELAFNSEEIVGAIETFGMFARNDDWVNGGSQAVAATDFRDAPAGLFTVPPQCYMHRQASFISSFFPDGTELGVDADFFYFPAFAEGDLGNPVLGAGTLWTKTTNDNEVVDVLMQFLSTPLANEIWMAQTGFLSAHTGVNLDAYADDIVRKQGEILLAADTFRFDGSDLMDGRIGGGAFWTAMVDYANGADAQEVADAVQAAWDAIKGDDGEESDE